MCRRFVLTLVCLASWSSSVSAATAFVQHKENSGFSTNPLTVALTSNAGAANLLAVYIQCSSGTITISSVTGNSNTYTLADGPTANGTATEAWTYYAKNINSGSTTISVSFSAACSFAAIAVHEISGADTTAPLDQHHLNVQTNAGTGANAYTSGSVTTTAAGEYIFGATGNDNASVATAGTGFTLQSGAAAPSNEDQIQSAASAIAATFTETDGFNNSVTGILTFKAASGGATRGLFQTPSLGGLGIGGSFFRDPLQFIGLAGWAVAFLLACAIATHQTLNALDQAQAHLTAWQEARTQAHALDAKLKAQIATQQSEAKQRELLTVRRG